MPSSLEPTRETILVVDDNEAILEAVVNILKRANFRVLSAVNGADAIRLGKETVGRIDMLLSDVDMPLMSGPDLGQELKKARPDMHVMLMSGGSERKSTGSKLRVGLHLEALCISETGPNDHRRIALTRPVTTRWARI